MWLHYFHLVDYVVCLDGGYGREMFNAVGNLAVNVIGVSAGTLGTARIRTSIKTRQ